MRLSPALRAAALLLFAAAPIQAVAQSTFVETFDGGSNEGGWTYGVGESIQAGGGNPGAYLRAPVVDTFAPQPRTAAAGAHQFNGDYRAAGVTAVGIDLILFDVDFSAGGRPLSVMLVTDNGTPGDTSDDWAAYSIGPTNIPLVGQGWLSYDFPVDSASTSFPPGWQHQTFGPNAPANPDWNQVITAVTRLQFFYGDPTLFYIFQQWEVGLDNPRITKDSSLVEPGRVPPTVVLEKTSPFEITLRWADSVCAGAQDYGVFAGTLGSYYSHSRIVCTDAGGDLEETISQAAGSRYYLVVPLNNDDEGSFGLDSDGAERPPATFGICRTGQSLACP